MTLAQDHLILIHFPKDKVIGRSKPKKQEEINHVIFQEKRSPEPGAG